MAKPCNLRSFNSEKLPKQIEKYQLDDQELDGTITLRILDGIAWNFNQAK